MTDDVYPSAAGRAGEEQSSGWAVGFILFAAIMMLVVGCFQFFEGLMAISNDTFYVATRNYIFQFDFWALLVIAVDVFVIWAVAAHGRVMRHSH